MPKWTGSIWGIRRVYSSFISFVKSRRPVSSYTSLAIEMFPFYMKTYFTLKQWGYWALRASMAAIRDRIRILTAPRLLMSSIFSWV